MALSENLREELKNALFEIRFDYFRDSLRDFILEGVSIVGLDEMLDEDLIAEYIECMCEQEDDLIKRCIAEMEVDKLLKT